MIATKGVFQRVTRQEILRAFKMKNLNDGLTILWESAKNKKSYDDFTMIAIRNNDNEEPTQKEKPKPSRQKIDKEEKPGNKNLIFIIIIAVCLIILALTCYPYLITIFNLLWNQN
jgi:hypothetical protein